MFTLTFSYVSLYLLLNASAAVISNTVTFPTLLNARWFSAPNQPDMLFDRPQGASCIQQKTMLKPQRIRIKPGDSIMTFCSESQDNDPEEALQPDDAVTIEKDCTSSLEPEDAMAKELAQIGVVVAISELIQMFDLPEEMTTIDHDTSEILQIFNLLREMTRKEYEAEYQARMSLFHQYTPRMQSMIQHVSQAIAGRHPQHQAKIMAGGQILAEELNTEEKESEYSDAVRSMTLGFFERYLKREYRFHRWRLRKLYPHITFPEDVFSGDDNVEMLHLLLLATALDLLSWPNKGIPFHDII